MSTVPPTSPPPLDYARPGRYGGIGASLREIGLAQRQLQWVLLLACVVTVTLPVAGVMFAERLRVSFDLAMNYIGIGLSVTLLGGLIFVLLTMYRMTRALGEKPLAIAVYLAVMCIPLVSIFVIFAVNRRATRILRRANIPVGFMGPRLANLPQG